MTQGTRLAAVLLPFFLWATPARADITVDLGRGPVVVHVPTNYDPANPAPLLLMLHGYSNNGDQIKAWLDMDAELDQSGFIYSAPDGTTDALGARFWNATDACCNFFGSGVDDSGYLLAFIDEVKRQLAVNDKRVYMLGHSNGGFMAYRFACDHSETVAAVVSLAGASFFFETDCAPLVPVHVLQIHGTEDSVILYDGGDILGNKYPSAIGSVERWVDYNGCDQQRDDNFPALDLDATIPGDETLVTKFLGNCPYDGSGQLWSIVGGSHSPFFSDAFGPLVVEYLESHPKPGDWIDLGNGLAGTHGVPSAVGDSPLIGGQPITLSLSGALENSSGFLVIGLSEIYAPFAGGILVPFPNVILAGLNLDGAGNLALSSTWPNGLPPGLTTVYQFWLLDPAGPDGFSASNALRGITP